ncbi:Ankyrin repeat-containing domain containing protein [Parasponia andersonii]|uniref:Ankyrin repeat-containing domain containing protein n=1 Tax=Parasponia andersonii TaxID=3476 RepID=A0A2P5AJB5_PARAD|nr:Ankyrin repeat-containing domain containing protein [Parasponia andersonii]
MMYDTLADHPDSLLEFVKIDFSITLLHAAAETGHLKFVEEIRRTCPDLAMKYDENRYLASHIAAKSGKYGVLFHMLSINLNFLHLPSEEDN